MGREKKGEKFSICLSIFLVFLFNCSPCLIVPQFLDSRSGVSFASAASIWGYFILPGPFFSSCLDFETFLIGLDKADLLAYDKDMTDQRDEIIFRKPRRVFEKSGQVVPEMSYYVPLENVVNSDKQDIRTMIDRGRYFSIFAPRQSGKTTFFKETAKLLHTDPTYVAITLSFQEYSKIERARFYELVEQKLYSQLLQRLEQVNCEKSGTVRQFLDGHHLTDHISFRLLFEKLNLIIQQKKIVIFIDEFDGIPLSELGNFLTSLRELYQDFKSIKQKALYSIGLVGIRNITKLVVGGVSPFNIADQVEFPPFSLKNIRDLYAQYTEETNQPFTEAAVEKIFRETAGQPWLVNRLGTILTVDIKHETLDPVDERDVEQALRVLLLEKNDHFDNLYEKAELYKETFVHIVFDGVEYSSYNVDQSWLEQYGLIKREGDCAVVANNIYKNLYVKTFFEETGVPRDISPDLYSLPGGRLDMEKILLDFNGYIMQIGAAAFYQTKTPYEKTAQFLLTAWLYQFVKEGLGELRYEVVSGLGRMDVLLTYNNRKYIIETKVNRERDITRTIKNGVDQVARKYLATEAVKEGYLVIFDPDTAVGTPCRPQYHRVEAKKITVLPVAIGRQN